MGLHLHHHRSRTSRAADIALIVFALIFCAVGCVALGIVVILFIEGNYRDIAFAAPFGFAFGGIGINLLLNYFSSRAAARHMTEARALHKNAPWMWRKDWADGKIKPRIRGWLKFVWYFAFLWNCISFPIAMMIPKAMEKGGGEVFLLCLFPAVGLALLAWAIEQTIRWRKFGRAILILDTFPGIIGGELRGVVETSSGLAPREYIRVELRCLRVISDSESTTEGILWQDETDLPPEVIKIRPRGMGIPICITIPYTCKPSSPEDSDDQVVWRLRVRAELKGLDFTASFDVPVFLTRDSRESVEATGGQTPRRIFIDHEGYRFRKNSAIRFKKNAVGDRQIYFPANRALILALLLGLTAAVVLGLAWALVYTDTPRFFPVMFGFFGLLFMIGAISYAFRRTSVHVKPGTITVVNRTLGLGTTTELSTEQVEGVYSVVYLDTPRMTYYEIKIRKKKGRPVVAGTMIPSKREAEWIADEIMSAFEI